MALISYLRCFLASEADRDDLEDELKELMERAAAEDACVWIEMGRDIWDDRKHHVIAEWTQADALDAFEAGEVFQAFLSHWPDERWAEPLEHRRLRD